MKHLFLLLWLAFLAVPCPTVAAVVSPSVGTITPVIDELAPVTEPHERIRHERAAARTYRKLNRQLRRAQRAQLRQQADPPQGNGMAVAGFICSLIGIFVAGLPLGILGVVFSAIGLNRSKREGRPLRGLAIAGVVLGIIAVVGAAIVLANM